MLLFVDYEVPHYDLFAGSRTNFMYLNLLVQMGLEVKLLPADFRRVAESVSDLDLETFFSQWVTDGEGHPQFRVEWGARETDSGFEVDLQLRQTQEWYPRAFETPLQVEDADHGVQQAHDVLLLSVFMDQSHRPNPCGGGLRGSRWNPSPLYQPREDAVKAWPCALCRAPVFYSFPPSIFSLTYLN